MQSASTGVNTVGLEGDIEKLNDKWNDLKERVSMLWYLTDLVFCNRLSQFMLSCLYL